MTSGTMTQPRQHLKPGITVRRFESRFSLEGADRHHCLVSNSAIRAVGIKPQSGQPTLYFLDFSESRCALASRKRLHKLVASENPIAQMTDRQGIAKRGVVGFYRVEVRGDQKDRAARHGDDDPRLLAWP